MSISSIFSASEAPNPMPTIFPQAVIANGMVFVSGNIGMDKNLRLIDGEIQNRVHQILNNISAVLKAAESSLAKIVKINIYLTNMDNFESVNSVYKKYFSTPNVPARTCVCVKSLPFGTDVEMECVALL